MSRSVAHDHAVQFYETDNYVCEVVARFVAEGLRAGHSVIAIITPEHRQTISSLLRTQDVVPEAAILAGQLVVSDARSTLGTFMRDGRPDANRFSESVGRHR